MSADDEAEKHPEHTRVWKPPPASDAGEDLSDPVRKFEVWLESLLTLAGLVVVIGIIAGFVVAFHSKVTPCENGHEFPNGTTDFNCYAHPHALAGGALIGASVFAGLLLATIGVSVKLIAAEIGSRQRSSKADSVDD